MNTENKKRKRESNPDKKDALWKSIDHDSILSDLQPFLIRDLCVLILTFLHDDGPLCSRRFRVDLDASGTKPFRVDNEEECRRLRNNPSTCFAWYDQGCYHAAWPERVQEQIILKSLGAKSDADAPPSLFFRDRVAVVDDSHVWTDRSSDMKEEIRYWISDVGFVAKWGSPVKFYSVCLDQEKKSEIPLIKGMITLFHGLTQDAMCIVMTRDGTILISDPQVEDSEYKELCGDGVVRMQGFRLGVIHEHASDSIGEMEVLYMVWDPSSRSLLVLKRQDETTLWIEEIHGFE